MFRKIVVFILFVALLGGLAMWWFKGQPPKMPEGGAIYELGADDEVDSVEDYPRVSVVATRLQIPWEVLFLPDGELLVTERTGSLVALKSGDKYPTEGVRHIGEGGLLGAALHPEFENNNYIYLYQTTETESGLKNRIVRYTYQDQGLEFDKVIFDDIPGARYHDGGRIAFGPDGYLYATIGDATESELAQDESTFHGTIIRITDEGEVPEDNPFGSAVYSYGHRNPQGLAWSDFGQLYSSEHGRSVMGSGFDEINRIEKGANYGWPDSEGDEVAEGTSAPLRHSTADVTWAPGSLAYLDGYLYMAGLRGETLYRAELESGEIVGFDEFLKGEYGRLRTVTVGPDEMLYVTTSNRDGRGDDVADRDDVILRINPYKLED